MSEPQPAGEAPDWNSLTTELLCPRCGYNLRLLPQPRCPECGLEFDWAELITAAAARIDCPLFEYQWRHRPVRSFFGTVAKSLFPWVIWRSYRLEFAPRVGSLAVFALLALLFYASCSFGLAYTRHLANVRQYQLRWISDFLLGYRYEPLVGSVASFVLVGCLAGLVTHIFQPTLSLYRIRHAQLLRVVVLSLVCAATWKVLAVALATIFWHLNFWTSAPVALLILALACGEWLALGFGASSMCIGLTSYLRVRRGWVIGLLASGIPVVLCVTVVLAASGFVWGNFENPAVLWSFNSWPGIGWTIKWLLHLGL